MNSPTPGAFVDPAKWFEALFRIEHAQGDEAYRATALSLNALATAGNGQLVSEEEFRRRAAALTQAMEGK